LLDFCWASKNSPWPHPQLKLATIPSLPYFLGHSSLFYALRLIFTPGDRRWFRPISASATLNVLPPSLWFARVDGHREKKVADDPTDRPQCEFKTEEKSKFTLCWRVVGTGVHAAFCPVQGAIGHPCLLFFSDGFAPFLSFNRQFGSFFRYVVVSTQSSVNGTSFWLLYAVSLFFFFRTGSFAAGPLISL